MVCQSSALHPAEDPTYNSTSCDLVVCLLQVPSQSAQASCLAATVVLPALSHKHSSGKGYIPSGFRKMILEMLLDPSRQYYTILLTLTHVHIRDSSASARYTVITFKQHST